MIVDRTEQSTVNALAPASNGGLETELEAAQLADALSNLHDLLEEYAPPWYTEAHHERVESALRLLKRV